MAAKCVNKYLLKKQKYGLLSLICTAGGAYENKTVYKAERLTELLLTTGVHTISFMLLVQGQKGILFFWIYLKNAHTNKCYFIFFNKVATVHHNVQ